MPLDGFAMACVRRDRPDPVPDSAPMRIAVPLEQCWHEVPGGTARTSIDLTSALAAEPGVEIVGVAARHSSPPPEPWRPTVPVEHLRLPRAALYESWHGLQRPRVEAATGPVDVCHVVGGAIAPSAAPLVVTVHDLAFLHHPAMFTRHGLRFFRRALQLTIERARLVFVPSMATLEDCVAAGIDRARLRHVPWGVTVSDPDDVAVTAARDAFGLRGDYVVMVGTLEPRKNLQGMLEAWRLLDRDVDLVVVGPEGWGDTVDPSLVPERLVKTGFVTAEVRDALYRGAAVSVYPSLFEGFGLPVLESMALGCPVVTSSGTSTEELVDDGAGLAVDPTDPAAIAHAVAGLLDDPAARDGLVERARRRASTYTWERTAAAVVDGYREVLA